MRLDRLISSAGGLSRSQAGKAVRAGRAAVNGTVVRRPEQQVREDADTVLLDGVPLLYLASRYYLLDKPTGLITASRDSAQKTVLDLFPPEVQRQRIFPVGRLDKDTSGLLLLTNDGDYAHRVISPNRMVWKVYEAAVDGVLPQDCVLRFAEGVELKDGTRCLPAELELLAPGRCLVKVREGKYHQVRRMLASLGTPVLTLRRLSAGALALPADSVPGTWRELSAGEAEKVFQ